MERKRLFANEVLEVYLEPGPAAGDPPLLSVLLPDRPADMPGEILVAPADIPDLVKALVEGAVLACQVK